MAFIVESLVVPGDVRVNADHLKFMSDEDLAVVIQDVHIMFIYKYAIKWKNNMVNIGKLTVIERLLSQHFATLNVRRADSESIPGMSKSITVPKGKDLDQTEYGQMAKNLGKILGLDWSDENEKGTAEVVIF